MAATEEMTVIALNTKPDMVTLVPEKREEVTTEGGLDVIKHTKKLKEIIQLLSDADIPVSLFVDPIFSQLEASSDISSRWVELHTGSYAVSSWENQALEFSKIKESIDDKEKVDELVGLGFIEIVFEHLRVLPKGRVLLNFIIKKLLT